MSLLLARGLLNYEDARSWRAAPGSPSLVANIQSPLGAQTSFLGDRYRVVIDQDGVYHLSYADLQAAGMDVENIDPGTFRLVNHGQDVGIYVSGEGDGNFNPGDFISFYGERFRGDIMASRHEDTMTDPNNIPGAQQYADNNWFWQCRSSCELSDYFESYTDENVYWLLVGGSPGPRMVVVDGSPTGTYTVPDAYFTTEHAEENIRWWSYEWYDDDIWFWDRLDATGITKTFTTTLTAVASGLYSTTVTAELSSFKENAAASPDHHSQFTLNTVVVDDTLWDGKIRHSFTNSVPQSALVEGVNQLHLILLPDGTLSNPLMYFDYFEITYAREFLAEDDQIVFGYQQQENLQFEIGNFHTSSVDLYEIYDISDPFSQRRITSPSLTGGSPYTITFEIANGSDSRYVVVNQPAVKTPKSISHYTPPDFANMLEADYVLITHANFESALQTLADYRAGQGYSVAVIDVDDLYNEFNDGIYHPIAIKNFLAYTFANWSNPPEHVLLVGSGHWNFKGYGISGTHGYADPPPVYMPPNLAYVDPWQGNVDATNLLATVVGDDTMPDVMIGRLPVDSVADVNAIIGKILDYESAPDADWQRNITFVADNVPDPNGAGDFVNLAEEIIEIYLDPNPIYKPLRIYQDDGIYGFDDYDCVLNGSPECDDVTNSILDTISITGTLILNYIGHASLDNWSHEQILVTDDLPGLNNPDQLPIVLSMTCLDGYWVYPNAPYMAHDFLNSAGKGAVATWSPTGLGVATGHDVLQRGFYASLFQLGDWQLGAATLEGKLQLFSAGYSQDLMHTFTLFGDPGLQIPNSVSSYYLPVIARP